MARRLEWPGRIRRLRKAWRSKSADFKQGCLAGNGSVAKGCRGLHHGRRLHMWRRRPCALFRDSAYRFFEFYLLILGNHALLHRSARCLGKLCLGWDAHDGRAALPAEPSYLQHPLGRRWQAPCASRRQRRQRMAPWALLAGILVSLSPSFIFGHQSAPRRRLRVSVPRPLIPSLPSPLPLSPRQPRSAGGEARQDGRMPWDDGAIPNEKFDTTLLHRLLRGTRMEETGLLFASVPPDRRPIPEPNLGGFARARWGRHGWHPIRPFVLAVSRC